MRILFLTPRFPCPPLRGDQVRAYHQIRTLGQRHAVTVLALSPHRVEPQALHHLQRSCEAVHVEPVTWQRGLAGLARLLTGDPRPAQTLMYSVSGQRAVQRLLDEGDFDVVHAQLVRTAALLPDRPRPPVVIDLVDTLSASYSRRASIAPWWLRPALAFERGRLARLEQALLRSGAHCVVVSDAERQALGPAGARAVVNPNGVDTAAFPFTPGRGGQHRLVFVGNLGYPPNTDAVLWFADQILPRVQARMPRTELVIVGPRAPRRVRALARRRGIVLAGLVPSVHDALAAARVAVAPLRAGGGIQNKVLEAMASGTAVVATRRAVSGIDAQASTHCLVADEPGPFADAVCSLLCDESRRTALVHAAHALVNDRYTWDRTIGLLEELYERAVCDMGDRSGPPLRQGEWPPGARGRESLRHRHLIE